MLANDFLLISYGKARLIKEYAEFEKENRNNLDSAVVFAEPLSLNGPDIRFWRAVIIGPPGEPLMVAIFVLKVRHGRYCVFSRSF